MTAEARRRPGRAGRGARPPAEPGSFVSLAEAWLLLPLALGLLSLGCGLLVERAAGVQLQRELLLPCGFAAIVVISLCTTENSATARLTMPIVVALALAGYGLALPWRPRRMSGWPLAAAAAVYAAFAAPVVLSGRATFAGYIKLDDTATWLAFSDRLLDHGRNASGLAPSTYEATLAATSFASGGYPVGAFPPLGVAHEVLGTDSAWLFQPYVAFLAAMLALGIYAVLGRVVEPRPLRALATFVAAQPALLYGYSLWGGVKELATAALLVLVAALTPAAWQQGMRARGILPLAIATAAFLGVLSFLGGIWIAPMLVPALLAGLWLRRGAFVVVTGGVRGAHRRPRAADAAARERFLGQQGRSHHLERARQPPPPAQRAPGRRHLAHRRLPRPPCGHRADLRARRGGRSGGAGGRVLGLAAARLGSAALSRGNGGRLRSLGRRGIALGRRQVARDRLARLLVAAMGAVGWLFGSGRRTEALAALLVVGGGVIWSNALAYHDVSLAPRAQLRELEAIGKQFAGDGPSLMTEYSPYGSRHFLRKLDSEGASELRRRQIPLRDGSLVEKGRYADIDAFALDAVLVYRTLVLMHSPSASRPPSGYSLVRSGRYYDVWQRPQALPASILEHVPLGSDLQPAAVPPCSTIQRLGRVAATSNGRLEAVVRPAIAVVDLGLFRPPTRLAGVQRQPGCRLSVRVRNAGDVVQRPGRRPLRALAGRIVPAPPGDLGRRQAPDHRAAPTQPPGRRHAARRDRPGAGTHSVTLRSRAADLSPGSGGPPLGLGPLLVSRPATDLPITSVQPAAARSLCGRRLDWIEAVAG